MFYRCQLIRSSVYLASESLLLKILRGRVQAMTSCVKKEFMNERLSEKKKRSFWSLCTSSNVLLLQSCFSSSNLHWLFRLQQILHRYPREPKKNLFYPLQSLSVYMLTVLPMISWSLLAISHIFFTPILLEIFPNWVISPYLCELKKALDLCCTFSQEHIVQYIVQRKKFLKYVRFVWIVCIFIFCTKRKHFFIWNWVRYSIHRKENGRKRKEKL